MNYFHQIKFSEHLWVANSDWESKELKAEFLLIEVYKLAGSTTLHNQ
jgi:hypothetical protein